MSRLTALMVGVIMIASTTDAASRLRTVDGAFEEGQKAQGAVEYLCQRLDHRWNEDVEAPESIDHAGDCRQQLDRKRVACAASRAPAPRGR